MKAPIRIRLVMNESVKEFANEIDVNKRQILNNQAISQALSIKKAPISALFYCLNFAKLRSKVR